MNEEYSEETEDEKEERKKAIVEKHVNMLMEHFDSVQIFVTCSEDKKSTGAYAKGSGNFYARMGYVREWLITQDEYVRTHARKIQSDSD